MVYVECSRKRIFFYGLRVVYVVQLGRNFACGVVYMVYVEFLGKLYGFLLRVFGNGTTKQNPVINGMVGVRDPKKTLLWGSRKPWAFPAFST